MPHSTTNRLGLHYCQCAPRNIHLRVRNAESQASHQIKKKIRQDFPGDNYAYYSLSLTTLKDIFPLASVHARCTV